MQGPIEKFITESGLTVVVQPVPTVGVISVVLGVAVGAADEQADQHGAAHFVEHMLFKTTQQYSVGEIDEMVEGIGGHVNAYTSHDETVYYITARAARWRELIRILGEMVFRARFSSEDLEVERKVILEELLGSDESASDVFGRSLSEAIWPHHPYGRPVGGRPEEVVDLDGQRIQDFWKRWYRPGNMTLSVAGPVDAREVLEVAEREFSENQGGIQRPRPSGVIRSQESPVMIRSSFRERFIELVFPSPALMDERLPELDVLATVLGASESSPLVEALQYKESLAGACWSSLSPRRDGGAFYVGCQPLKGREKEAVRALWGVLERVCATGFSGEEVARAKALIAGERELGNQTVESRAMDVLWHQMTADEPREGERYIAKIAAVSAAELRQVAEELFDPKKSSTVVMLPGDDFVPADFSVAPPRYRARASRSRSVRRDLPGGTTLLVESGGGEGLCAVRVLGLGGRLLETPSTAGRSRIWASSVVCGAGDLNNKELADRLSLRGAGLAAGSYGPTMKLGIDCRREVVDEALEWTRDLLLRPHFEASEIKRLELEAVDVLETLPDRPGVMTWLRANRLLFGGHPYGLPKHGSKRSLKELTPAKIRRLHRDWVRAGNLVISVVGSGEPERVADRAERLFAPLGDLPGDGPRLEAPVFERSDREEVFRAGRGQSHVVLAWGTGGLEHDTRLALDLAASVLASPAGRLFQRIRDRYGLAYDLEASHAAAPRGGCFSLELSTEASRSEEARDRLLDEIRDVASRGVFQDELERAKAKVLFAREDALQRAGSRAAELAYWERCSSEDAFEKVPRELEALQKVSASQIQSAVEALLSSTGLVCVRSLPKA